MKNVISLAHENTQKFEAMLANFTEHLFVMKPRQISSQLRNGRV